MNRTISGVTALFVFLALSTFSCSGNTAPASGGGAPAVIDKKPFIPSELSWQENWQRIKEAARKEGKLLVYSSLAPSVRDAIAPILNKEYGIDAEFVAGSGNLMVQKMQTERRAGLFLIDAYLGGSTTMFNPMKPSGILDPMDRILIPEMIQPEKWMESEIPFLDKDHMVIGFSYMIGAPVLINTRLVKEVELKHFNDLLAPRWKGQIIMHDPTINGSGGKWFYMTGVKQLGIDYLKKLLLQEPLIIRDQRLQTDWIARGKYSVGIAPKIGEVVEFIRAGASIKEINVKPEYTTTSGGNIGLVNRAPHPGAARVFINWMLTREGQSVFMRANNSPSKRKDVDFEGTPASPARIPKPGETYFNADTEELLLESPQGYEMARNLGFMVK